MQGSGIVFTAPDTVALETFEVSPPGPGEVLVEVECSLVSPGTERTLLRTAPFYPFPPSYSAVGRIAGLGAGVESLKVGDPVLAHSRHASHVICAAELVHRIPDSVHSEAATFASIASMALFTVREAQIQLGDPVAVLGQGIIGLLSAKFSQFAGGAPVIGLDVSAERLAWSRQFGIDMVLDASNEATVSEAMGQLPGGGPASVIELTAKAAPLAQAIRYVRRRGRVVMGSLLFGGDRPDVYGEMWMKGVTLAGGFIGSNPWSISRRMVKLAWPNEVDQAETHVGGPGTSTIAADKATFLTMLALKRFDVLPFVTHRLAASEMPAKFLRLVTETQNTLGVIIRWA